MNDQLRSDRQLVLAVAISIFLFALLFEAGTFINAAGTDPDKWFTAVGCSLLILYLVGALIGWGVIKLNGEIADEHLKVVVYAVIGIFIAWELLVWGAGCPLVPAVAGGGLIPAILGAKLVRSVLQRRLCPPKFIN
jgi:hypothetical protein